jgi:hypothetical protein
MTNSLTRIKRSGQKPPFCKKPPFPPVPILPWPPTKLYCAVEAHRYRPTYPHYAIGAHLELTKTGAAPVYEGEYSEATQKVHVRAEVQLAPDAVIISVTYYPPAPEPSATITTAVAVPGHDPLYLETTWAIDYPWYTAATVTLAN